MIDLKRAVRCMKIIELDNCLIKTLIINSSELISIKLH